MTPVLEAARFDRDGLIPAVVQDVLDGTVLMVAWMNREALQRTLERGETWFWSRSRQELWHKGATSGHLQKVRDLRYDCDSDVLLVTVEQQGDIACHLGERSCFHRDEFGSYSLPPADTLSQVFRVIEERKAHPSPDSYTSRLLEKGSNAILKKLGEETAEVVMAAKDGERVAEEVADLWYHTLVLLAHANVDILDVYRVLQQRRR
ncbi:bifunctional phosphoribosyl-AMP cyclohydrolase/phosphoribosyl-ATP pyrophosphatase protein [Gloeobacter kilaueensis JS1]|uniref:Histidine biosynthesis bifunctional protein HisIE n=1 Tax=Gloeobacter kilaueensis (strain ATCC BAA-2537 / CCAP 1431/1 / ULC 316 / JS1) TaxID=1183438 RepID=U5QL76_GLOK1|nr:bifunctional phosphoribosyl-AMP cyclohydrolase/phosphoribosyl-ATP diphosphatase HisIE [Gloeobacter kilaueensis]AGY59747.1 bifunctional phosphoribosyl-AMP cyclohydrolase/phosphoribosyl-ATP pyrophosphatase protein [Gloeobacter kilaueensis JS1]